MPRPVIPPISKMSRLFIHIAIYWLAYELNTILGPFIHSFIIDNTEFDTKKEKQKRAWKSLNPPDPTYEDLFQAAKGSIMKFSMSAGVT
jgi:hypothetical protein